MSQLNQADHFGMFAVDQCCRGALPSTPYEGEDATAFAVGMARQDGPLGLCHMMGIAFPLLRSIF
jgi:hypothetical protein